MNDSGGSGSPTALTYDDDDALTSATGGVFTYGCNANGDQTGSTISGQGTTYAYDALGRQVPRTAGGLTTTYLYDGQILLERQGSSTTATYVNALVRKDGEFPLFDGWSSERPAVVANCALGVNNYCRAFRPSVPTPGTDVQLGPPYSVRGHIVRPRLPEKRGRVWLNQPG